MTYLNLKEKRAMNRTLTAFIAAIAIVTLGGLEQAVAKGGGILSGTITYDGDAPKNKVKKLDEENAKTCKCEQIEACDLRIDKESKGIANVVVEIIGAGPDWKSSGQKAAMDQKGCVFIPHIVVVPPGAEVLLKNSDEVLHNVKTTTMLNPAFNEGIPAGSSATKKFDIPEKVKIGCDVHPWMGAWVIVTKASYHAVTDDKGKFEIKDVPPGKYKVRFWHEKLGQVEKELEIAEGGKTDGSVALKKESK